MIDFTKPGLTYDEALEMARKVSMGEWDAKMLAAQAVGLPPTDLWELDENGERVHPRPAKTPRKARRG